MKKLFGFLAIILCLSCFSSCEFDKETHWHSNGFFLEDSSGKIISHAEVGTPVTFDFTYEDQLNENPDYYCMTVHLPVLNEKGESVYELTNSSEPKFTLTFQDSGTHYIQFWPKFRKEEATVPYYTLINVDNNK